MNEWYAKDTSNKIKAVFDARMKDGKRCSGSITYGYNRLPTDKQTLVIDPVASEVVKSISFCLPTRAKVPRNRRNTDRRKGNDTGGTRKEYHREQYNGIKFSDPYIWGVSCVRRIFKQAGISWAYCFEKSLSAPISNCTKERLPMKMSSMCFYNTHEPIIS